MPVVEDEEEAPHVYGYLCDLVQANHPAVLGLNNGHLPNIVRIVAEAFYQKVVDVTQDVGRRMLDIVKQIEKSPDVFQACLSTLNADQKEALQEAYRVSSAPASS